MQNAPSAGMKAFLMSRFAYARNVLLAHRIRKTAADIKPEELGVKYVTKRYQDYAKEMFPNSLKDTSEIKLVRQDMGYGIR